MANPLLRLFSQIGLTLATAVGKAFGKAYKQVAADAAASQRKGVGSGGGAAGGGSIGWLARRGMPADEAYKVLNIEPKAALPSDIQQVAPQQRHTAHATHTTHTSLHQPCRRSPPLCVS